MKTTRAIVIFCGLVGAFTSAPHARAFTHVVRRGESLASIAKAAYGRDDLEYLLVGANALDVQGGSSIAPGMRLDIPALVYRRAALGDTWASLAERFLGDPGHATVLSEANHTHPWLLPEPGAVFAIPYVLRHVAAADETVFDLAERYYGDKMAAWRLVVFNTLASNDIKRGQVVLVPLDDLGLSPGGEAEAAAAVPGDGVVATGSSARARQHAIEQELPPLSADVDAGRYIEAVARGAELLGLARDAAHPEIAAPTFATQSQRARIGKLLTEAYAALDAPGAAADACTLYLDNVRVVHLEPASTSPKVRAACTVAREQVKARE